MYNLPYFKANNDAEVVAFMRKNPFVVLCGVDAEQHPVATQVPVLIEQRDGKLFLQGHMMRHTDHQKGLASNKNVLAIFTGAHSYVSASWYTNPLQGSTWNYVSVHARGTLQFLDEAELRKILDKTTAHFENNNDSPSLFHKLPAEYVDKLVKAIVAFEIQVSALENVFKLSQNRDEESYESIIQQLEDRHDNAKAVAQLMRDRKENVFRDDK